MKPHLLPMHYRLGRILGLKPADVKRFYWEAAKRAAEGPQPTATAGVVEALTIVSVVASAISVGLTIIAQFFRPGETEPARLKSMNQEGRTVSDARRFAPRNGFDSLQEPASIGQLMPLVFALKETIDGETYGGVRVNCPLLWSQLQTTNGQQLLRTIFLIGDGGISAVDTNGFALGNSLLNAYNLGPGTELGSSYVAYLKPGGGRIASTDRVAGRLANLDPGNAENQGGLDVFSVRSVNRAWASDFCCVTRPGSNTVFGLYSPIGNNLAYRINPVIKPQYQAQLIPKGDDGDAKVICQIDDIASTQRSKTKAVYSTRSGFISGSASAIGDTLIYVIDKSSDVDTDFSKAFNPSSWSVNVEVERVGGSGTTVNEYGSNSSSTGLRSRRFSSLSTISQLQDGIQWLNQSDQVVSNPVVSISQISNTKVALSTRLQYDASGLTNDQKRDLLYSRFKLTFVNSAVDEDDEPSVYYRVDVEESRDVDANYDADFVNQTFSANYSQPVITYVVESTVSSRQTLQATLNKGELYSEPASDIASTIAGKQEQWDDAIQIGSLYRFGSALVVCTGRSPEGEVFYSEANFSDPGSQNPRPGQSITATFTVVRPGTIALTNIDDLRVNANAGSIPQRYVATNFPHLFKISIATITTTRPTRLIEIIIRSNLGIRINGLCNFRDTISYGAADNKACLDYRGDTVSKGSTLKQYNYTSGTVTTAQMRYSFFRIKVRISGTNDPWIQFPERYCIRGINQQNQFNTIRIQFPSIAQWEVEFEPISGWEVRSNVATGTYVLIDDRRSSSSNLITRTFQSVVVQVYGKQGNSQVVGVVDDPQDPFRLPAVRKDPNNQYGNLGYGYTDDVQFVDEFGALAETFVFSEVTSSAEGGPEHEIVSVTEIVENESTPTYPGMAVVGLNLLPGNTFSQLGQFSSYVNAGYPQCRRLLNNMTQGATHLFPDIALELLTNPTYGLGDSVSDDQVDIESFTEAARWCYENRYFYDSVFVPTNIKEWIAQTAEQHLLYFLEIDGRFTLQPMFPHVDGDYTNWNEPVKIKGVFGLLQMKSFSFSAIDEESRRPVQSSGRWREERRASNITNPGIFPVEREILVREAGDLSSEEDPINSYDLSDFATNEKHLIDFLKMKTRVQRITTHGCTFELTQDSLLAPVKPGDYVQIPVEITFFDEYKTGIIKDDGTLVATMEMAAGEYQAITWDGVLENQPIEQSITVNENGSASPTGIIFAIKESTSDYRTYRILDIDPSETSGFTVSVIESPTDENGRLVVSQNWGGTSSDQNWVIQK